MDSKENFLETLHWGHPTELVNSWEPFGLVFHPLMSKIVKDEYYKDSWGVTMYWGSDEPGIMPIVNDETKVIKDITHWRDYVTAPDLASRELDWSAALGMQQQIRDSGKLSMVMVAVGLFEESHCLMGFDDALANYMLEPEYMHELLDCITDYKMEYFRYLVENLKPDVILHHDDWGTKTNLFMRDTIWRDFFKERYTKLYSYLKDNGIIVMHHADSHCELIVDDMIDMGIDIWQGVLPQNNIPAIQEKTRGKMLLMGGIDAPLIDVQNFNEEAIRAEVRRACDAYAPGGGYIPSLTYGSMGSVFPGVEDIVIDEINNIKKKYF